MPLEEGAYVVLLGVAPALPPSHQENTYLAVGRGESFWLLDCAGAPIQRLRSAGLDPLAVEGVIVTHFHPDHVYGLPAFALGVHLLAKPRRYCEFPVFVRSEVLVRVRALMDLYAYQGWLSSPSVAYHEVPATLGAWVAETADFTITAAPSCHSVPSLAVRFDARQSDRSVVYSRDAAPCDAVLTLARGASLLVHEGTVEGPGHSTAADAGALAAEAGGRRRGLVHTPQAPAERMRALSEAHESFGGPVHVCEQLVAVRW